MSDARVAAVAARQHGLVTRKQASAAGLSAREVQWRVEAGRWLLVRRGVYAIAGVPPSREQAVLAAVLAVGRGAIASHLTAAQLWGLAFPAPQEIHVTTGPGALVSLEGVRHHRSRSLHPHDRAVRHGVPVESPARTIVSCSGSVPDERLELLVDDAERRQLVRLPELAATVDRIATGPGRRPTVVIRSVVSERLPVGDSPAEKRLVRDLVRRRVPMPVLGHVVVVKGRRYKLDVAWPWAMLSLEYESWAFHGQFAAFHRGHERARRLRAAGWDLWPVTSRTDPDELADDLLARLCVGSATPRVVDPTQRAS